MKSDARMAARADTRSARLELNGGVDRTPELSPADADAAQRLDFPQWQQDAWEAMWKARGRPMPTTTYRSRPEPAGGAGGPAT
jgi:hypothetical protein